VRPDNLIRPCLFYKSYNAEYCASCTVTCKLPSDATLNIRSRLLVNSFEAAESSTGAINTDIELIFVIKIGDDIDARSPTEVGVTLRVDWRMGRGENTCNYRHNVP
jgi:hypothetical protein